MNLHEYQAKKILKKRGVPIPDFGVASNTEEAKKIADQLELDEAVVKIQVHAGGRGKAGGVKFAKSREEIYSISDELIGMKMVNNQRWTLWLSSTTTVPTGSILLNQKLPWTY